MKVFLQILFLFWTTSLGWAQGYWQQRVEYKMNIDFDVTTDRFVGDQTLTYYNNSPDTLNFIYYHLYYNAFQPESMMDMRSLTIEDPDARVGARISKLTDDQIGFHQIISLNQDGKALSYKVEGTVLEVKLVSPILPNRSSEFTMKFRSQVPIQIRRCGRDSKEGIEYSMSQWFPKVAEYDRRGWHAHPYVGREFYAPWGRYEVNIRIDENYVIAASGTLQNPNEIGYGYETEGTRVRRKGKKLTWRFKADNVHDFVWAADPDYLHTKAQVSGGPVLHFFYQEGEKTKAWEELPELAVKAFSFIEENFGKYPYSHYSIIQGGDGGMEYPMATLITGERNLKSLVGVTVHEILHSWYQGLLATNESYYAWMDEGFTTYASAETMSYVFGEPSNAQERNYSTYTYLANSGKEEPLSTHADHFLTNMAYGLGSYYKGAVALAQMNYLVGPTTAKAALKEYYQKWKFKHPDAIDFIRTFEKESELELDWYLDYWINTTHTIDYAVDSVGSENDKTQVYLSKIGNMPMPIDIYVGFKDGTKKLFYAPLSIMRGEKKNETDIERVVLPDWPWTHPRYEFEIDRPLSEIQSITIDESGYLADVRRENNRWVNP